MQILKYLVEHGADPNEIDHAGKRPVSYARSRDAVSYLNKIMK